MLEKNDEGKEVTVAGFNNGQLKIQLSKLQGRVAGLQKEVQQLENLVKAHKEEYQEDKLCLIKGVTIIGRSLGYDRSEDVVEEVTIAVLVGGLAVGTVIKSCAVNK